MRVELMAVEAEKFVSGGSGKTQHGQIQTLWVDRDLVKVLGILWMRAVRDWSLWLFWWRPMISIGRLLAKTQMVLLQYKYNEYGCK